MIGDYFFEAKKTGWPAFHLPADPVLALPDALLEEHHFFG